MLKPLPVGIQTFRDIIEGGYLYVDKTALIYELIRHPKGVYFLSRPRRFGKSVLLSTLNEIFIANKELFKGLDLYQRNYDWTEHPIIRIDFSRIRVRSATDLEQGLQRFLLRIAREHAISLSDYPLPELFDELIYELSSKGKVVILIDEYDKPIIDNITNSEEAIRIRDVLKSFYTIIKALDEHIRFVFLTGISRFGRVGVFSDLNNLRDISLDDAFATLPGITQTELEQDFVDHIQTFAEQEETTTEALLARIRHWYNGFPFSRKGEAVYNPFSLLLFFSAKRFSNFWFESGTPTFLIKLIQDKNYNLQQIEERRINETSLSIYDLENLPITPLLLQTGYLTIQSYDPETQLYALYYPNREVEDSFLTHLLGDFSPIETGATTDYLWQLIYALQTNNLDKFWGGSF
ncbi:AAA family ATPase [Chloroflexi bacterium TSY]|nr:AAA family ATPase [Chloroflexi bacterium TSY]